MGSLARMGLEGTLGSPVPNSFSAITLNSYSQPSTRSCTLYWVAGYSGSLVARDHLLAEGSFFSRM